MKNYTEFSEKEYFARIELVDANDELMYVRIKKVPKDDSVIPSEFPNFYIKNEDGKFEKTTEKNEDIKKETEIQLYV
jgi:hypothetical protein